MTMGCGLLGEGCCVKRWVSDIACPQAVELTPFLAAGLGKTVEAIALVMLSRETTVKGENAAGLISWDDALQLDVRKIQVSRLPASLFVPA